MMKKKQIRRAGITLVLLVSAFFLTSFYLAAANLTVQTVGGNIFATETMQIGILGDGTSNEIRFLDANNNAIRYIEPGMTLRGSFTVKNDSTFAVYYRLRFTDVSGGLADVMEATVKTEQESVLCGPCTVNELTDRATFAPLELGAGQSVALQLELHFPEETGNEAQNKELSCKLTADMTQVRNNDNKYFEGDEGVQHPAVLP